MKQGFFIVFIFMSMNSALSNSQSNCPNVYGRFENSAYAVSGCNCGTEVCSFANNGGMFCHQRLNKCSTTPLVGVVQENSGLLPEHCIKTANAITSQVECEMMAKVLADSAVDNYNRETTVQPGNLRNLTNLPRCYFTLNGGSNGQTNYILHYNQYNFQSETEIGICTSNENCICYDEVITSDVSSVRKDCQDGDNFEACKCGNSYCVAYWNTDDLYCNQNQCGKSNDAYCNDNYVMEPIWSAEANSCVAAAMDDDTCDVISSAKPKWSTVLNICVAEGTDDNTCAAISSTKPVWSAVSNSCVACLQDINCGQNKVCSNANTCVECLHDSDCIGACATGDGTANANTCVAAGGDDNTCAVISSTKPKWSTVSNSCVECSDDSDCSGVCATGAGTANANTCVDAASDDTTCAAINSVKPKWVSTLGCVGHGVLDQWCKNYEQYKVVFSQRDGSNLSPPQSGTYARCVLPGTDNDSCYNLGIDLDVWNVDKCVECTNEVQYCTLSNKVCSDANTCVAKGTDDNTCAAISSTKPVWSAVSNSCVAGGDSYCAEQDATKPKWSTVSNSCVAAGTDDNTCAAISSTKPRMSTYLNPMGGPTGECVAEGTDDNTCAAISSTKPVWSAVSNSCIACLQHSDCGQNNVCTFNNECVLGCSQSSSTEKKLCLKTIYNTLYNTIGCDNN